MNFIQLFMFRCFGWHYVLASSGLNEGVYWVMVTPNGRPYFKCWGMVYFLDIPLPLGVKCVPLTFNQPIPSLPEVEAELVEPE